MNRHEAWDRNFESACRLYKGHSEALKDLNVQEREESKRRKEWDEQHQEKVTLISPESQDRPGLVESGDRQSIWRNLLRDLRASRAVATLTGRRFRNVNNL